MWDRTRHFTAEHAPLLEAGRSQPPRPPPGRRRLTCSFSTEFVAHCAAAGRSAAVCGATNYHSERRLRDIVAHLAGAQAGYAEALEHVAQGESPSISDYGPPDPPHEWNGRVVERSQGRPWDQLLKDLDAAQARHEAAARACGAVLPGNEPARFFARNVALHEAGHLQVIKRWLAGEHA